MLKNSKKDLLSLKTKPKYRNANLNVNVKPSLTKTQNLKYQDKQRECATASMKRVELKKFHQTKVQMMTTVTAMRTKKKVLVMMTKMTMRKSMKMMKMM